MNNQLKYILMVIIGLLLLSGCQNDEFTSYKDRARLYFPNSDSTKVTVPSDTSSYTFLWRKLDVKKDTIWIPISTMGFPSSVDRHFKLKRVPASVVGDTLEAEEGKHYQSLNEESLLQKFVIPAGSVKALFPIVVYRHASMKDNIYQLNLMVEDTDEFHSGIGENELCVITMTDKAVEPKEWNDIGFGHYSNAKLYFIIAFSDLVLTEEDRPKEYVVLISWRRYFQKIVDDFNRGIRQKPTESGTELWWFQNDEGKLIDENGKILDFEALK